MTMITNEERKLVEEEIFRDVQDNPRYGLAAFKFIYHLLRRIGTPEPLEQRFTELVSNSRNNREFSNDLAKDMQELLDLAFRYATEFEQPLYYTTGQIGTYFGVSTTTIHNWLRERRISYQGMDEKPSFKQARIPDIAIYKSPNGKPTMIREIVQERERQQVVEPPYDEVERIAALVKTMLAFEEKYGGKYHETAARLGDPESSSDWTWSRDAAEWRYVMQEIAGER